MMISGGMELISLVTSLDSTGRTVSNTEPENRGSGIGGAVKVEAYVFITGRQRRQGRRSIYRDPLLRKLHVAVINALHVS